MSDRRWAPRKSAFAHLQILPVGQITQNLSSPSSKNIPLSPSGKSSLQARPIPFRKEGRWPSSRTLGWDAVDARQRRARDCDRGAVLRERSCSARTNGASTPPPRLWPAARGRFRDWWRLLRTAKPCGPGTRCWCQAGGGCSNPTGFRSTVNSLATVTRRIRRRGEHGISR